MFQEQIQAILNKKVTDKEATLLILNLMDLDADDNGPEIDIYDDYIRFNNDGSINLS